MHNVILRINIFIYLTITTFACSADTSVSANFIDGITITITSKPFDAKKHKIKRCGNAVCAIDNKILYGGDGKVPKQEVTSLVFSKDGEQVKLNVQAMYETGITKENMKERFNVQPYLGKSSYRVIGYFGKAKEPYIGHWLVWEDTSIRNHLSDYESLVSLLFEVNKDHDIPQ